MPISVIHDNDGHVDDLLSALLLWLAPEIDLQAICVTAGDSFPDQSYQALCKMATFLDLEGPEIAYSDESMVNDFPENWRRESVLINQMSLFSENAFKKPYQQNPSRRTESVMADCLRNSTGPVTVVTTGPLTNVANVFEYNPDLKSKVSEFVIMGGAISAKGNVEQENADGSQEWNFYADAPAVKRVFDTGVPIKLIPLDLTNQLPFEKEFLRQVERQAESAQAAKLAASLWGLVKTLQYYFWDTVTACAVIKPALFTFKDMRLDVITHGLAQGKTAPVFWGGRKIKVAVSVDKPGFQNLILQLLKSK